MDDVQHYCVIKNLSRLISHQYNKHREKKYICRGCLNIFNFEGSLKKHIDYCYKKEPVNIEMPKEGSILKFKIFFWKMRVPFVVYVDFECFTEKLDTCHPNDETKPYTKQYQKHTPSGFTYYIKCFDNKVYIQDPVKYTKQSEDDDIAQIFIDKLVQDTTWICRNCGRKKMTITPKQQRRFQKATKCWICREELIKDKSHQDYKRKTPSQRSLPFYRQVSRACS